MREAPKSKSGVLLSIVVDRATGMFALILVSIGVFAYFHTELMALPVLRPFLVIVGIIFGFFIGLIMLGLIIDRFHLAKHLPAKMPGHAAIIDIARAFSVYASSWQSVAAATGLSLVINLFLFGAAIFAAFAFVGNPGPSAMISVIPIVTTISSLPISLSGIGVREGLFALMLNSLYGTPKELATLISLTGFSLAVAWGLIGGIIYLTYRPGDGGSASLGELESQIVEVEHEIEIDEKA